jgi:predicted lipase
MEFGDLINQNIYNELSDIKKLTFITSSLDGNVYIWKQNKKIFITFRGTSSNLDILIDLYCTQTCWKDNIYVHSGFKAQFMSLEKHMTNEIESIRDGRCMTWTGGAFPELIEEDIEEIHCSGYSLGAGLATLAAAYYGEKYHTIKVTCMTIGSPKVGNEAFVNWFEKNVAKSVRLCNCGDLVPMVPFWPGWCHVKNVWYIKDKVLCDKKYNKWIKKQNHELTNYINALL